MTDDRELSDLKLERKECPKCGAVWINGQHYWSGTGNKGNELDLAGLVCNNLGDDQCINPVRGQDGGDNWEKRMEDLERFGEEKQGRWWDK
jgi:hypothetical protein